MIVLRSRSYERCAERAFVLTALDIPCVWRTGPGGMILLEVPAGQAARALREIVLFDVEQAGARSGAPASAPPPVPQGLRRAARAGAMVYVAVLLLFAVLQTRYGGGYDWLDAGRLQAALVRQGEWWRAVTALTLHLDTPHLLGNLIFGALFGFLASVMLATAAGAWFSILIAGTAGNLLNAWLQPATHTAVGASTAVFAALGLIAGYQWRVQLRPEERWLRRLGPLVAGVALLAMLGSGGERTDVGAHLTGFVCGVGAGVVWSAGGARSASALARGVMAVACPALIAAAWQCALAAAA